MSSESWGASRPRPVRPTHNNAANISAAVAGEKVDSEMGRRAEDLMRRISEQENKIVREEGRRPIVSPVPERPAEEEVREHNVPLTPPKAWCTYCTKASAVCG